MQPLDKLVALAQVFISTLFLIGYFVVMILFMLGYARVPVDFKEAFAGLLSLLSAGGLTVLYFWFQRSRVRGVPDPTTTTTTTSIDTVTTPTTPTPPPAAATGE